MMPALRNPQKPIHARDFRPGDRISGWGVQWVVNQLGAQAQGHHIVRGVVQRTTEKMVWIDTRQGIRRYGSAGLLARGVWRSARYEGEAHRR